MQIKTTMRDRLTRVRMAIIKKSTNNTCWRTCGEKGAPYTVMGMWIGPATMETSLEVSLKTAQNRITVWHRNPTPGHILGEHHNSKRKWQPTPVFLPGKSHGQRSLVGYSSWGCKELDPTERTCKPKDTCTPIFIAALFTIAKTWKKHKCPSKEDWIKVWCMNTMEFYSAIKRNETVQFAETWMDPKVKRVRKRKTNL